MTASPPPVPPRARGAAIVAVEARGGATRLARLRQEGSLKVLMPRGDRMEAVLLNTAGGLTGGDRMAVRAEVGAGATLALSTQAAERLYRAADGEAVVEVEIAVKAGGRVLWLPQETIVFDGAAIRRTLRLDLAAGAGAVLVEPVALGRRAMGEVVARGTFRDRWEARMDGRLLFADALRIEGGDWAALGAPGALGGATAWASVLVLGPDAGAQVAPLRSLLGAASLVREGVCFARLLAEDGWALRRSLVPALEAVAGPLPKVWRL